MKARATKLQDAESDLKRSLRDRRLARPAVSAWFCKLAAAAAATSAPSHGWSAVP